MRKLRSAVSAALLAVSVLALTACGKAEFGLSDNTGKEMTVTAKNADKDLFFAAGSLEVEEGETAVMTSHLEQGEVKVELFDSSGEMPDISKEAIMMFIAEGETELKGTLPEGSYMIRATVLKKASGTVTVKAVKE